MQWTVAELKKWLLFTNTTKQVLGGIIPIYLYAVNQLSGEILQLVH